MKIQPRKDWTPTSPGGDRQTVRGGTLYVHWTVTSAAGRSTYAKQCKHMRELRSLHLGVGDADIAYSFVIFPPKGKIERARVFRARGVGRVPASQLGANAGNVSVAVVLKPGEYLDAETKIALKKLTRHLVREGTIKAGRVKGHRDQNSTECPGDGLYRFVKELRKVRT